MFSKVMNYFTEAELSWLGYDIHIFWFLPAAVQVWDDKQYWQNEEENGAACDDSEFHLVGHLHRSIGLHGKGTRVFAVESALDQKPLVIKDCWDPTATVSDHIIHTKLQDPLRDSLVVCSLNDEWVFIGKEDPGDCLDRECAQRLDGVYCHIGSRCWDNIKSLPGITIMQDHMRPSIGLFSKSLVLQSVTSICAAMMTSQDLANVLNDSQEKSQLEERHRSRTSFTTCGVNILWFGTAREMFHSIIGTVISNAYKCCDVLHCDVSDGNTMFLVEAISAESTVPPRPEGAEKEWTPMRNGMASDWGSAIDCLELGAVPATHHKSLSCGTLPFESNASMLNSELEFYHDLESYFWLAYLITCNCAGPFNMCRDWDGELERFSANKSITPSFINHLAEVKMYGKVFDVDRPASPLANQSVSPVYYPWVRPGVHSLSLLDIVQQRNSMTDVDFTNLMTPYFIRHEIVRDGMLELRSLFLGSKKLCPDGFVRRDHAPPTTHERVLSILRRIRDGIDAAEDQYPQDQELEYARVRYQRYLKTGNRMLLLVDEDDSEGCIESKRKAAQSEALVPRATKRARGLGASEAGFGAPVRVTHGRRTSGKTKK
ncbi:hypothetical protein DFJ58DRAFT_732082 [Suillus subalutaceus]|uniref:uncharacterized protein n=1 Tax=Suillus subalutaceus TaxID=48586 RepID=UPI001B869737|nr:uncharacterized protein DFJ58DRAFT_732082 [Suillus subalutaceus]KAG1842405.1 hypothetical protein DFJ58DRAFT_732082 [Suillus subalutaceus]